MATVNKKLISALVSINYSDFLDLVLPFNTKIFDTIYVITAKYDKECIQVCSKHKNVKTFFVDDEAIKKHGNFNKGAIWNVFFDFLISQNFNDWICLTDSDIIFPPDLKSLLVNLDDNSLYSLGRAFCQNENQFSRYTPEFHNHSMKRYTHATNCIGYMQLFKFKDHMRMSEEFGHGGKSDHIFVNQYFRKCTCLHDKYYCVHLGSTGTNWGGRRSRVWNLDN